MKKQPQHLDGLEDELRDHLDRETQDNIDRGMTPQAARAAARSAFGNVAMVKENIRAVWIPVWFDQLVQDVRYGLRMMRRSIGFTVVAVVTLALGIGLNTAVFSVVSAVLLRPLSYPHPDRVVWLATVSPTSTDEHVTAPDFLAWRDATTLEGLVAYDILDDRIAFGERPVPARIAMVTDDFWALAGAHPANGRLPLPGEDAVMLSHAFFERWFGHQPDVVGSMVTVDGRTERVAGVLPAGFHVQLPPPPAWAATAPGPIDVYRAFSVDPPVGGRVQLMRVLGLLAPGVSMEAARSELETIRTRVARENPGISSEGVLRVTPLAEKLLGAARLSVLALFTAVILVLLVACANIASLLLARAGARQREIAIRGAIGASRARLIRQFLAESLLLTGAGAGIGLWFADATLQVMLRLIPQAVPRLTETTIDARVLAFALVLSMVTAVLCGLGPALALARGSTAGPLKNGARTARVVTPVLPVRTWLVAVEMALTVVLLCSAGLLVKSSWRLHQYPDGFAPDRTLIAAVKFFGPGWEEDERRRAYLDEGLRRLEAVPGVEAVGLTTNGGSRIQLFIEGAPRAPGIEPPPAAETAVSTGYAQAIGLRVVAGRWFGELEPHPVFVINESLARRDFGGRDPIGQRVQVGGPAGDVDGEYATVIGVVADLRSTQLDAPAEPEVFTPYAHGVPFAPAFVVRTRGSPRTITSTVRASLVAIDPAQDVGEVTTLEQALAESIAPRRFNVWLFGVFAGTALLLASIGIYGVVAYSIARRTHEFGVRIALGADRRSIASVVIRQGMSITVTGLVLGLAAALGVTRGMSSLLYGVTPTDPATFAMVAGVISVTALVATCVPAFRAARTDPLAALRSE